MSRLDDRLTRELERIARPAAPADAFQRVDRRRARRHMLRRVQAAGLVVVVLAGTVGGFVFLSNAFREAPPLVGGDVTPLPIVPKANGVLVAAQQARGGPLQLVSVSPDGSDRNVIESKMTGDPWHPAWSPDGTRLAVAVFPLSAPRAIWVLDADGANAAKIAEGDNVSRPSWSPDGTQIAYAADSKDGSSIHIVNADGTDDRVIGDTIQGKDYFSASFSPDGTQIAFDKGTDSGFGIYVMNADGSDPKLVSSGPSDYNPSWSPDGSQIVFTRQEQGAESDIYVMNADGTEVRQLTDDGPGVTNIYPEWSPDGQRIAYVAGVTGGAGALVVVEPDGSHPVTILNDGVLGISWQPLPVSATPSGGVEADGGAFGFPVCNVSVIDGTFRDAQTVGAAYVATKMSDVGVCPPVEEAFNVIGVDVDSDGLADVDYGPIECRDRCYLLATPDVDTDGSDEIAVAVGKTGGSIKFELFSVAFGFAIQPLGFDCSSCNSGVFLWGGPGGHMEGAYCLPEGVVGDFVTWTAERADDGTHYALAEFVIDVKGPFLVQVDRKDSFVPYDLSSLPEGGRSDFCGAPVAPSP